MATCCSKLLRAAAGFALHWDEAQRCRRWRSCSRRGSAEGRPLSTCLHEHHRSFWPKVRESAVLSSALHSRLPSLCQIRNTRNIRNCNFPHKPAGLKRGSGVLKQEKMWRVAACAQSRSQVLCRCDLGLACVSCVRTYGSFT